MDEVAARHKFRTLSSEDKKAVTRALASGGAFDWSALSDDAAACVAMEIAGATDEITANFIVAIERGEITGDSIAI